jgi:hypothetical protein
MYSYQFFFKDHKDVEFVAVDAQPILLIDPPEMLPVQERVWNGEPEYKNFRPEPAQRIHR